LTKKAAGWQDPEYGIVRLPVPDYVAFDLETTGLSPDDDEILEVAFARFEAGRPVERWSTLLNPLRRVPLKALRLTHIDAQRLSESPVFGDVSRRIEEMSRHLPLVGHNSPFDTAFLAKRIQGFPGVPVYDTLELSRIVLPGFPSYKLTELAEALGIDLTDAHRAYDDAEVSGRIFALIQERVLGMGPGLRETVTQVMGSVWTPRSMFLLEPGGPSMRPLFEDPVPASVRPRPVELGAGVKANGSPAGARDGTPGEQALRGEQHLPKEARPARGSGASEHLFNALTRVLLSSGSGPLAAHVPLDASTARAVFEAVTGFAGRTGGKVLLAGFPDRFLPMGIGRAPAPEDYVCLSRLHYVTAIAGQGFLDAMDVEERRFLASVCVWAQSSETGSFSEIQVAGSAYGVVRELGSPKGMECSTICPFRTQCRYLLAERSAGTYPVQSARLDRALTLVGEFDRLVVWGAHELQRVWQYREERVDLSTLRETLRAEGALDKVPAFERLLHTASSDLQAGTACADTKKWAALVGDQLSGVIPSLRERLQGKFCSLAPDGFKDAPWADPPLVSAGLHYLERGRETLAAFSTDSGDHIALLEASYGDERKGPFLVRRAIWPAREAVKVISTNLAAPILLSDIASQAGATHGGRRMFLGLDLPGVEVWSDPGRAEPDTDLLLATADVKGPASGPAFTDYASALIFDLASRLKKGLLVLLPSRALIRDVYAGLAERLEEEGIVVYAQGVDGGRRVVEHLQDDDSVVLASAAFHGEEEPVPACLLVMKVPFPPPNPLDDMRRREMARAGGDPFVEVSVRPASLQVRSYAARMLGAGGKRAIVLADPRLAPGQSRWRDGFLKEFEDLTRESGPVEYLVNRVARHLSGNP
jgi:DNA polymerase III epsilon subunit-like protein